MTPLERVIKKVGGRAALAKAAGVVRATVYLWDKIPAERVLTIEKATGIRREELRPDLYAESTKR